MKSIENKSNKQSQYQQIFNTQTSVSIQKALTYSNDKKDFTTIFYQAPDDENKENQNVNANDLSFCNNNNSNHNYHQNYSKAKVSMKNFKNSKKPNSEENCPKKTILQINNNSKN